MGKSDTSSSSFWQRLHRRIDHLYHGTSKNASAFRIALMVFDALAITYFLAATFVPHDSDLHIVEEAMGVLFLLEFVARLSVSPSRLKELFHPASLADLIVIVTLLAPTYMQNFAFLRVARTLRLLRTYHMLNNLRQQSKFVRLYADVLFSVINLVVFIFVITAVVYVTQSDINPQVNDYIDALYFTIATLTTTGFGDITLVGTSGHILAVLIMVFGISLFLRLIQTIFRPNKINHECPKCGLNRHDVDAIHCKHCGNILRISTEGVN